MAKKSNTIQDEPLKKQLREAADKLRKNIDAAKYKHLVMVLIFLRYISDTFEELYSKLQREGGDYSGVYLEDRIFASCCSSGGRFVQSEKSIYSYFQKMFMSRFQIHTLEKLRDALLPS